MDAITNKMDKDNNMGSSASSGYGGSSHKDAHNFPIALDLDGDGVELVGVNDSTAAYDFSEDGYRQHTGWVSGDDALLAIDLNHDGLIAGKYELAFAEWGEVAIDEQNIAAHDFNHDGEVTLADFDTDGNGLITDLEGLRYFDSNQDGQISQLDNAWDQLRIWQDHNQDGISDAGELSALDNVAGLQGRGIQSISLDSDQQVNEQDGNITYGQGHYTLDDNSQQNLADVAFRNSGLGLQDNQDGTTNYKLFTQDGVEQNLLALDETTQDQHLADISTDQTHYTGIIGNAQANTLTAGQGQSAILSGEGGDDTLLGSAQKDVLLGGDGQDTLQGGLGSDVLLGGQGDDTLQGGIGSDVYVFERGHGHDTIDDQGQLTIHYFSHTGYAYQDSLGQWHNQHGAIDPPQGEAGQMHITWDYYQGTGYVGQLATGDYIDADKNILDTAPTGTKGTMQITWTHYANAGWVGEDDTGHHQNDQGQAIDITTLDLGEPNTSLPNSRGDTVPVEPRIDTHAIASRSETLTIEPIVYDSIGQHDTLVLGEGITWADLIISVQGDNLVIGVGDHQAGIDQLSDASDTITIQNYHSHHHAIETIQLANGETLTINDLLNHQGTAGDDILLGDIADNLINGGAGDDQLFGGAGYDQLDGGVGEDVLSGGSGNDQLAGGADDDQLSGGTGDDQLHGGSGDDILDGGTGNDLLMGGAGNDTITTGTGNDLVMAGSGDDVINAQDFTQFGTEKASKHLDGGAGHDTVTLAGQASDYTIYQWGEGYKLTSASQDINLINIEAVYFADELTPQPHQLENLYQLKIEQALAEERDAEAQGDGRKTSGGSLVGGGLSSAALASLLSEAAASERVTLALADSDDHLMTVTEQANALADEPLISPSSAQDPSVPSTPSPIQAVPLPTIDDNPAVNVPAATAPTLAETDPNSNTVPDNPVTAHRRPQANPANDNTQVPVSAPDSAATEATPPPIETEIAASQPATPQQAVTDLVEPPAPAAPAPTPPNAIAPVVTVTQSQINEDNSVSLGIQVEGQNAHEHLTIYLAGVPADATLSHGFKRPDGHWQLSATELTQAKLIPAHNSAQDITLTVIVTSYDITSQQTTSSNDTLNVTVNAVADTPNLSVQNTQGHEDSVIALTVNTSLNDTDGSETQHIIISGVPTGASLNQGIQQADGTWQLLPAQLTGLTITPAANSSDDFVLTITSYATESENNDVATSTETLNITVNGVADVPNLQVQAAQGDEDTAIALTINTSLNDTDGSETQHVIISGVPTGASLNQGTQQADGTWKLLPAQLTGLTIIPPTNSNDDFVLTVTSYATEGENTDVATSTETLNVTVNGVADAPNLQVQAVQGNEDSAIALTINTRLNDTDGSETQHVIISGVPAGASLNQGTQQADGTWTLLPAQLTGLTITPFTNSGDDFTLTATSYATEGDNTDVATSTATLNVTVNGVADAPNLQVQAAQGDEDSAIALTISTSLNDTDSSETQHVIISGVPNEATLSNGTKQPDGTWRLSASQLEGLSITPPANSGDDFVLTVTSYATEGENTDIATSTDTINVTVNTVADKPNLSVNDAQGNEDAAIALTINTSLNDTDGSETQHVIISGVPAGASLSQGIQQLDGTWRLTASQLEGLTITPAANSSDDFVLTVTSYVTEGENSDTATSTETINVTVNAVADKPNLQVQAAQGDEDSTIALTINTSLNDTDGSETQHIIISGVPAGASLNQGTQQADGTWTLLPAQLTGLTITPPANSNDDFVLTVTSYATEGANNDVATSMDTLNVTVNAVADTPNLSVQHAQGNEDTAIALTIDTSLNDTDSSETQHLIISGVPTGARFNQGTQQPDGTWKLLPSQLTGLTITPLANSGDDFVLTVTSYATEGENNAVATNTATLNVTVHGVADAPELIVNAAQGNEDNTISLSIQSSLTDTDGTETLLIIIEGVPAAAKLNHGSLQSNGDYHLLASQLEGLTLQPPVDSDEDITLKVIAQTTDTNTHDVTAVNFALPITINALADTPNLQVQATQGDEDTAIALAINTSLNDTDGSETQHIIVSGVPGEATLSNGTKQTDGTWRLSTSQLEGLTITPPTNSGDDFVLTVTSYATEGENADVATSTETLNVTVNGVADTPNLSVNTAQGNEDTAIALSINTSLNDTDGSETQHIIISGVPVGASLNQGTQQTDGTWKLLPAQLTGLTITPPANSGDDFALTVTSVTTESENNTVVTSTDTLNVMVNAVADTPNVSVQNVQGTEDTAIPLVISTRLNDTDGSETQYLVISEIPEGATLNQGIQQADGSWHLTPDQLTGLTITPPKDSSDNFALTVTSVATEGENNHVARHSATIDVTVHGIADAPELIVNAAQGDEDNTINLSIQSSLTDTDGTETLLIIIEGVPAAAKLNRGSLQSNGDYHLLASQLEGLTLQPPADSDEDITLKVIAQTTDINTSHVSTVDFALPITINAVADTPNLSVQNAQGDEDTAIALVINTSLNDTDGSEAQHIIISGVPGEATLNNGTKQADGTWKLLPAQLTV